MKSVLISIQPQWCERIALRYKTIEVRKKMPKMEPPFRCFIYQTKKKWRYNLLSHLKSFAWVETVIFGQGNVIGEFICDTIVPISVKYSDINSNIALREFPWTGLTDKQIIDYLGNGVTGYGWHISNLKIYDKPKKLYEFWNTCNHGEDCCIACPYHEVPEDIEPCMTCDGNRKYLLRPPQSWCYVMEV